MPGISDIANAWKTISELDLRPIRDEAERGLRMIIISEQPEAATTLANMLRTDPARPDRRTDTPLRFAPPSPPPNVEGSDLILLLIPGDPDGGAMDWRALVNRWRAEQRKVLVFFFISSIDGQMSPTVPQETGWNIRTVRGRVDDAEFLQTQLVPAVLSLLPWAALPLGRFYPLFRSAVARQLINDTALSNAAYSLTTGLAELVPVLNVPLNLTDMFVLTKSQAFLVYRLGLALGMSARWQSYVTEFGSVLGGGFLWRQISRSLIGLIPAWGLVPKVGVAYAGTFATGEVIYHWYLTDRKIDASGMRALYERAYQQGKQIAAGLIARAPKGSKQPATLPKPDEKKEKRGLFGWGRPQKQLCASCGSENDPKAKFCNECGQRLGVAEIPLPDEPVTSAEDLPVEDQSLDGSGER